MPTCRCSQVSLPARLDGERAYAYGQALAPLAEEGVLVIGSGSLTHNLYEVRFDAPDANARDPTRSSLRTGSMAW